MMKYTNPIIEVKYFGNESVGTAADPLMASTYAADRMANRMYTDKAIQVKRVKMHDIMQFNTK